MGLHIAENLEQPEEAVTQTYEERLSKLKRAGLIDFDGTYYRASALLFSEIAA